jgi:hypothetical protein
MQAPTPVSVWLRALLWIVAAVVPGGLLLVPLLVADELGRRRAQAEPVAPTPPIGSSPG